MQRTGNNSMNWDNYNIFSDIYSVGTDCRKISWFYKNTDKNQYFNWDLESRMIYANVIINKYWFYVIFS